MCADERHEHLSRISTLWSLVVQAHGEDHAAVQVAQSALVDRYAGAIYRYLRAVLRDSDAADEVFQEFALGFVQGGYRHAHPAKGRFRDYVKISVLRLVSAYRRRQSKLPGQAADHELLERASEDSKDFDRRFQESRRDELLDRAWQGLKILQDQTGRPLFAILDLRSRQSKIKSNSIAAELNARLSPAQPFTATGVRKSLQEARSRFAELLLYEVRQMIGDARPEQLEQELIDLGLHPYCHPRLRHRED